MEMKDILAILRTERDLKQSDVAQALNVVPSAISKYELGRNYPEYDTLLKIADFYGVNLDYLFGRTTIRSSIRELEEQVTTRDGMIPIDLLFQLNEEDKELVRRLLVSLSNKPEYLHKKK